MVASHGQAPPQYPPVEEDWDEQTEDDEEFLPGGSKPRPRRSSATWVTQQARNLLLRLEEYRRRVHFLIRDRDAKFCRGFDDVFGAEGAEVLVTPVQAPNANAYAERWIRSVRAECLDWLLVISRDHLEQGGMT